MISTFEEALLLLNKWRSDSATVVLLQAFMCPPTQESALGLPSGTLSRTTGIIVFVEEGTGTFTLASGPKDFTMVSPAGCTFGYDANTPLGPALAKWFPSNFDSALSMTFPNGTMAVMFVL